MKTIIYFVNNFTRQCLSRFVEKIHGKIAISF